MEEQEVELTHAAPNEIDDVAALVRHGRECSNNWLRVMRRSCGENYVDGHFNLLLEFAGTWNAGQAGRSELTGLEIPSYVTAISAKDCSLQRDVGGEVGNLAAYQSHRKAFVIFGWNKQAVLIDDIQFIDHIEKAIPSRFWMGTQAYDKFSEGLADPKGVSLLYGSQEVFRPVVEGKLDCSLLPFVSDTWRNDFPIGVVKSGSYVVNGVSANERDSFHSGFVSFDEQGTFVEVGIGFENIAKGWAFLQRTRYLTDVFVGPVNLEQGAIWHEKSSKNRRTAPR